MLYLVISLAGLGVAVALVTLLSHSGNDEEPLHVEPTCATCDGSNSAKCEMECMMEAATREPVYFDDEELDAYKGRPADAYTDAEAGQFGEILYSMRPGEVGDWSRSLTLRGIELPNQLRDEVILLMSESG